MFDALYPDAADAALTTKAARPPEPQSVPWFKNFWGAVGSAIPRAGAEMGRAATALLTPEAVGATDAPSMFAAPAKKAKEDYTTEIRQQDHQLADAIKEFTPDPNTTGTASMILHDVTRFAGKATAYGVLGGAPGAVAGMALDEGTNETLRRIDEGVDPATAVKLGVVHGVASGAAVALPVAGKSLVQTAGLALAGGPGSYIAEQATAREILKTADYTKEADAIDPFDPLGIGVAFLGSLLFGAGAHALRGRGVEAGAPDAVDAAHVAVLQGQREATALHAPDDIAAGSDHALALDRASQQIAAGERVSVADVAPADGARMAEAIEPVATRIEAAMRETPTSETDVASQAVSVEPAAVGEDISAGAPSAAPETPTGASPMDARLQEMDQSMPVMLEGMDAPRPMREVLDEIMAQAKQETEDAGLLQVAAECALRG